MGLKIGTHLPWDDGLTWHTSGMIQGAACCEGADTFSPHIAIYAIPFCAFLCFCRTACNSS